MRGSRASSTPSASSWSRWRRTAAGVSSEPLGQRSCRRRAVLHDGRWPRAHGSARRRRSTTSPQIPLLAARISQHQCALIDSGDSTKVSLTHAGMTRLVSETPRVVMASKTAAVEVDAGGRAVRVSSPDRVIFPASDAGRRRHEARGRRVLRRGRRRHRAGAARPAGLAGALAQGRAARHEAHRPRRHARPRAAGRRVLPEAADARHARMGQVSAGALPVRASGRPAVPRPRRRRGLGRPDGRDHLPPVAGALRRRRPPRRAAHRPRPARLHVVRRCRPGRPVRSRSSSTRSASSASRRPAARTACTSTSASSRRWTFTDVRHAAIALGRELERRADGVTTAWWKEERGDNIFVDVNQNCRDRTIASAYSLRPKEGGPVSTPVTWDELADPGRPERVQSPHRAGPAGLASATPHAAIDDVHHSLEPLLDWWKRDLENGLTDMPYPPEYPKMPGEPKRVQPSTSRSDTSGNVV